jgi:malate dehydrogenase (oxaloacetate-decarboxylating)
MRTRTSKGIPSAGYSFTAHLRIENKPGMFSKLLDRIAELKASLADVTLVASDFHHNTRDVTVNCMDEDHMKRVLSACREIGGTEFLEWKDDTFSVHQAGKIEVVSKVKLETYDQMSRVYTPGVARVCQEIHEHPEKVLEYTSKANSVAIITDGSAVLGLGDLGPCAALPVMEGKAVLFKHFADIDAYPICLNAREADEIVRIVEAVSPSFGGINLEDIAAPRCFEIEERLDAALDIPVFHDDQHGTAVVVLAGLYNALKIVGKKMAALKVVVNGFGAAGVACSKLLSEAGVENIIPCDRAGAVFEGRTEHMNAVKYELSRKLNPSKEKGQLEDVIKGADLFIGVSAPGVLTVPMVESMAADPIVFALSNPIPEIMPCELKGVARIVATGRCDYANQVNNVLCFPGIFRGVLNCRAKQITTQMKLAAAEAIADLVSPSRLSEERVIPSFLDGDFSKAVADAVSSCGG